MHSIFYETLYRVIYKAYIVYNAHEAYRYICAYISIYSHTYIQSDILFFNLLFHIAKCCENLCSHLYFCAYFLLEQAY